MTEETLISQLANILNSGDCGEANVIRILRRLISEDEEYEGYEIEEKEREDKIYLEKEKARKKIELEKRMSLPESEWGNCPKCEAKMKRSYKGNFYCACQYA